MLDILYKITRKWNIHFLALLLDQGGRHCWGGIVNQMYISSGFFSVLVWVRSCHHWVRCFEGMIITFSNRTWDPSISEICFCFTAKLPALKLWKIYFFLFYCPTVRFMICVLLSMSLSILGVPWNSFFQLSYLTSYG